MAIVVNLDVMMAKRKKGLTELAGEVDIKMCIRDRVGTMAAKGLLLRLKDYQVKASAAEKNAVTTVSYTHLSGIAV